VFDVVEQADPILSHSPCGRGGLAGARTVRRVSGQGPGAVLHTKFEKPEFIAVKCDEHPWMHGYFVVLTTSHYAVTGRDGGFSLRGLPPGKYTVTAWHEQFGTQSQDVTISGSRTKTINFVFRAGSGR
jgi:carboxypeptidase family protein